LSKFDKERYRARVKSIEEKALFNQRMEQEFKEKQYFQYMEVENGSALVNKKTLAKAKLDGKFKVRIGKSIDSGK
jgi:hypothetical protein